MRVIAGKAGRTVLIAPEGIKTRPTPDRAKESLFNILGGKVPGARFLDIFCGSGAIGIEALSRGAEEAVFVESAASAVKAVKANLAKTKLAGGTVLFMTAGEAIAKLSQERKFFDIIFLDPPYKSDLLERTLSDAATLLSGGGLVIAETDADCAPQGCGLTLTNTRVYGRTKFLFYSRAEAAL